MTRCNTKDYRQLFLNDTPMMDMRAPIEFTQGAFPTSNNLPLMTDEERSAVGICYKQHGQEAAIKLGLKLVSNDIKTQRIAQWKAFCADNPNGYLYCFRGGQRSRITQQWLKESGVDYPFVEGGYKAMRRFLLDTIEAISAYPLTIVAGYTGSGKTLLVNELKNGLDLEGAANHRGSSFGRYVTEQHTQINFDNILAVDIVKKQALGCRSFILEDEGKNVGSANVPLSLYAAMQTAPIAIIEDPFDVRLERLRSDYVVRMKHDFITTYGEDEGWTKLEAYLERGLYSIRKRLGLERYAQILLEQKQALATHRSSGDINPHFGWLTQLLELYYDPMYHYQLSKKTDRVQYRGDYAQVKAWLADK
jgi:tRNA 2-selenouridine synthase